MTSLDKIGIRAEPAANAATGNAAPVLHQIRHALAELAETGNPTIIDLAAIPFAPGDRKRLLDTLGEGEVDAVVQALGRSRVRETAFPGVWLVQHFAPDGAEYATQIEVSRAPSLLMTPDGDVADSAARLGAALEGTAPSRAEPDATPLHSAQE